MKLTREVVISRSWTADRRRRVEDQLAFSATLLGATAGAFWVVILLVSLLGYVFG